MIWESYSQLKHPFSLRGKYTCTCDVLRVWKKATYIKQLKVANNEKSDFKCKKSPGQHIPGSFLWEKLRDAWIKWRNTGTP